MIAAPLQSLLAPLETFEAIRRRAVSLGDRLCDLSYANPYGGVAEQTRAVLRAVLEEDRLLDLQYSPFGGQTVIRRVVADALRESHQLDFALRDITLTPGAMAALQIALRSCGEPGDEVLIPTPCWLDYPLYAQHLGLTPRLVPLTSCEFELDFAAIAAATTPRTCALLLAHPANPTGRLYDLDTLQRLGQLLADAERRTGRRITLIADETHRDFSPAGAFRSAVTAWPTTLIVYSFGKYHFLQGQRIGYLAVSPAHPDRGALGEELVRWTRVMGFCTPTALMQRAVPALLALEHDLSWLTSWRDRFTTELRACGYHVAPAQATLFLYASIPGGREDFQFTRELAALGVLVLAAPIFHHQGWFRLSLTGSEPMLERALATLCRFAVA